MKFQGALMKEQGVTFGIIVVNPNILNRPPEAETMQNFGIRVFGPVPIVLMAQNPRGNPTYYGRRDIVEFLSKVPMQAIPWCEYTLN